MNLTLRIWPLFLLVSLLLPGCSVTLSKYAVVQKEPLGDTGVEISKSAPSDARVVEDCEHIIILFGTGMKSDFDDYLKSVCPKQGPRIDVSMVLTTWYIPYIYGHRCITLNAVCPP